MSVEWLYNRTAITHPIPLFEIHGTEDRTTRHGRAISTTKGAGAPMSPSRLAVDYWAAKNKCTVMQTDTLPARTRRPARSSPTATRSGTDGNEVWLYETVGGKHSLERDGRRHGRRAVEVFQQIRPVNGKKGSDDVGTLFHCCPGGVSSRTSARPARRQSRSASSGRPRRQESASKGR